MNWVGNGLFVSMIRKLSLFHLMLPIPVVLLVGKWMVPPLVKNHLLRYSRKCLSLLDYIEALTLPLLKFMIIKKTGTLIRSMIFLSSKFALYLYQSP